MLPPVAALAGGVLGFGLGTLAGAGEAIYTSFTGKPPCKIEYLDFTGMYLNLPSVMAGAIKEKIEEKLGNGILGKIAGTGAALATTPVGALIGMFTTPPLAAMMAFAGIESYWTAATKSI